MPTRLSIRPISIGDHLSLTGDTDHFLARMRPSPIPVDIIAGTKNRHKCRGCRGTPVGLAHFAKRSTAMIGAQEPSIVIDSSAYNLSSPRLGPRIGCKTPPR